MVFKKLDFFSALDTSRPRQITDIQYGVIIMGGREVSRPYQVWFAEGERFLSFWHRQKAVFYVFCFGAPSIYSQNRVSPFFITDRKNRPFGVWEGVGGNKKSLLSKGGFW